MAKLGNNLTTGSVFKTLVGFALPFFMSNLLQSLYGATDMFVVGRFCGPSAISAVSIGSQVMSLFTFVVIGIASGCTVLLGQSMGKGDTSSIGRTVESTISLFLVMAIVGTPLIVLSSKGLCSLMQTPQEALAEASTYVKICSLGLPCIICFNVISAIFRGLGDSRTPMYIVAVAAAINIFGDFLLTGRLGMGATGVAYATVAAQGISSLVGFLLLKGKGIQLEAKGILKPQRTIVGKVFAIGLPLAAQDAFITISFLFLTVAANLRGLIDSSAVGIVEKIMMFMFLVPGAMLNAVTTITSQNYGAGKMDRARATRNYATAIIALFGCLMVLVSWTVPEFLVGAFISDEKVMKSACEYLKSYSTDTIAVAFIFATNGFLCGIGKSLVTFIHSAVSVALVRIPLAFLLSYLYPESLFPMGFASPLATVFSILFLLVYTRTTGALYPERQK